MFGDVWERTELPKRDRSLVTVAALIAGGNVEQLKGHLARAKDNGLTESQLKEVIIHLTFYAGWPRAMSAITVATHPEAKQGAQRLYEQLAITAEDIAEIIAFAVMRPRRATLNEILVRPTAQVG